MWEDTSKLSDDKKYIRTFFLAGGVFAIFVFLIFQWVFGVNFGAMNQSTIIAYIFLFICFLIVIGPYMEARYKMIRDGKRNRIAFDKKSFYFISERDGKKTDELQLKEIKAVFLAPGLKSCFFAKTKEEKEKLKKSYLKYKQKKDFAETNDKLFFDSPADEALSTFKITYDSINLFYYLSEFARGERVVDIVGLTNLLDSLNLKKKKLADGYLLMYES